VLIYECVRECVYVCVCVRLYVFGGVLLCSVCYLYLNV